MLMSDGKIEPFVSLQRTKTSSESPIKAIPVLPDSFQPKWTKAAAPAAAFIPKQVEEYQTWVDLSTSVSRIVNTSYIIRVEMESDGRAEIYMSDGTMFRCDHFDASQLYGTNEKKEGATSLHLQEELRYDQSHSMST